MIIFTRTACLGGDIIYEKLGNKHDFRSQGKVRVDFFLDLIHEKAIKPDFSVLSTFLARKDMEGTYQQASDLSWLSIDSKPDCIILDNYSELTDKRFLHKNGWSFCGAYGDLDFEVCQDQIKDEGLLDLDRIEPSYDAFFKYLRRKWDVPIIFLHFPTTFETRKRYLLQGEAITQALANLSCKYDIQNIHADPEEIEHADNDTYHFTNKTAKNMASKISLLNVR